MTPCQKIKRTILAMAQQDFAKHPHEDYPEIGPLDTPEQVEEAYGRLEERDYHQDYESDFRRGEWETGLGTPYSRHYESTAVAAQMSDGTYVGWVYWYGGGKHGEPGAVPWMEDAYEVEFTEETRVVRVWKKKGEEDGV